MEGKGEKAPNVHFWLRHWSSSSYKAPVGRVVAVDTASTCMFKSLHGAVAAHRPSSALLSFCHLARLSLSTFEMSRINLVMLSVKSVR